MASEDVSSPEMTETAPPRPRRRRRAMWLSLRGILLICLAPLICAALIPVLLIGQEITAPSWIKERVEVQAAEVLGGGSLSFGEITVTIATDLHPTVRMREVVLRDAGDAVLARVPVMEAVVSPRGLLFAREVMPQTIILSQVELALRRGRDGTLALTFEREEGPAADLAQSLAALDAALELPALEALEAVEVEGLILNYADARAGRTWLIDGGAASLQVTEAETALSADLTLLSGRAYVTTLALNFMSPRGSAAADIALDIVDVPSTDIATQSPALSWLSVLDAKVSAQLRAALDEGGVLGPVEASVDMGAGALQPDRAAAPIGFETARARLQYDPDRQRIRFEQVEVTSDWGSLRAEGQAYLRDLEGGLPGTLLGQFQALEMSVAPEGLYETPLDVRDLSVDFRLGLDPFVVDVGYLGATLGAAGGDIEIAGAGWARSSADGWALSADGHVPELTPQQLLALWPEGVRPGTRRWFTNNLLEGRLFNVAASVRTGEETRWALTHEFAASTVRIMRQWPAVERAAGTLAIQDNGLTVTVDAGVLPAGEGGGIDLAGSAFLIPRMGVPQTPAEIRLETQSSITAALWLLDQRPFGFISRAELPVTLADGRARVTGEIGLPLAPQVQRDQVRYDIDAVLSGVMTDQLVPGRRLQSGQLRLSADPEGLRATGPVTLGGVSGRADWSLVFGQPGSRVTAEIGLGPAFLREFNIGLPEGTLGGSGTGTLMLDLRREAPPRFRLTSDLAGLTLRLPALGWAKGAGSRGAFEIAGTLGDTPRIEQFALDVAGLRAEGDIVLRPGGGLDRMRLGTLRLGNWLNANVTLIGRGEGRPVGINVAGGSLDLRQANFGTGTGQSGPMELALDRLQVTDGIVLSGFRGVFEGGSGLNGRFTAQLGGTAPIEGALAPVLGRTGVRIQSSNAGAVLAAAGLLETATGGALDLTLRPTGGTGTYDGTLAVRDLRVREAPALAALLDAISVIGLLQQLDGQGLRFTDVDAQFRLTPAQIVVTQASAVGPGLGISVDGIYTLAGRGMDFQGVISPIYLINGIGSVLTRPGEGLIGFNFTLRGAAEQARVQVNPLSVLTPGMFREIFRRPVPVVE